MSALRRQHDDQTLPGPGDVELTDVQPLLSEERAHAEAGGTGVYPVPSSSYSRDGRGWVSKLMFSWIDPVLGKVRRVWGVIQVCLLFIIHTGTVLLSYTFASPHPCLITNTPVNNTHVCMCPYVSMLHEHG